MLPLFIFYNARTPGFTLGIYKEGPYLEFQVCVFLFSIDPFHAYWNAAELEDKTMRSSSFENWNALFCPPVQLHSSVREKGLYKGPKYWSCFLGLLEPLSDRNLVFSKE